MKTDKQLSSNKLPSFLFKDKALAKWSFTAMYDEFESAFRSLLISGKNFDTGWGYSTDNPLYLCIKAEDEFIQVKISAEIEPDDFNNYIYDAAKDDRAKEYMTDDFVDEMVDFLNEHDEYTKAFSQTAIERDKPFKEVLKIIGELENQVYNTLMNQMNCFKEILYKDIIAHLPDKDFSKVEVENKPSLNSLIQAASIHITESHSTTKSPIKESIPER